MKGMPLIAVFSLNQKFKILEKETKNILRRSLKSLRKQNVQLDVYLAGNELMLALNRKFRGKNSPANVLSFKESNDFVYPPSSAKRLGEIYLNVPYVRRRTAPNESMAVLLIHGLLHLLGYTHEKKNDRIEMERLEKSLFKK